MKRSTFIASLIGLASTPLLSFKKKEPKHPEWAKDYALVKTKSINQYPLTEKECFRFDRLNVVDFRKATESDKLQLFVNCYYDRYYGHIYNIEQSIIHSKEITIHSYMSFPHSDKIHLYCMSGFKERYGRLPNENDKIRIVYGILFNETESYDNNGFNHKITSELNWELI